MLGAMDTSNIQNDLFTSGLHNEDELSCEPEKSLIIDHNMVDNSEYQIQDAQPASFIVTKNSNLSQIKDFEYQVGTGKFAAVNNPEKQPIDVQKNIELDIMQYQSQLDPESEVSAKRQSMQTIHLAASNRAANQHRLKSA